MPHGPGPGGILSSPLIDQVLLVGQGQRGLGALVVPNLPQLVAGGLLSPQDLALAGALTSEGDAGGQRTSGGVNLGHSIEGGRQGG